MSGVSVYVARRREIQPSRKASFGRDTGRFCSSHAHHKAGELTCAAFWRGTVSIEKRTHTHI